MERLQHVIKETQREYDTVMSMSLKGKQHTDQLMREKNALKKSIATKNAERTKRLEKAKEMLDEQVRMQQRREDREKRRKEIALEVAGDLGAEEEARLKKLFVAKQMYSNMLGQKIQQAGQTELERGFQKIKNALN